MKNLDNLHKILNSKFIIIDIKKITSVKKLKIKRRKRR